MNYYKKITCAGLIVIALFGNSCNKLLEERPQSQIVPSFFSTPSGLLGGIAGVYNDMRNIWGTEGFSLQTVGGTDENLMAASNSAQQFFTYNGLTSSNTNGSFWNNAYQDINTLNGILEFGQTVALTPAEKQAYLAQAKFLRAFWYFYLVQTFGDVPLHLEFITSPSSADSRQPAADVYAQIITDLTEASTELSPTPTAPFLGKAATQGAALYLLAKVYLTRGWLTNSTADFTQAYTIAKNLIDNRATYGLDLWQDYADAFKPANDYGKETIFVSDHSSDVKYGRYSPGASGGGAQNLTPWFNRFNYPTLGINSTINASGVLANSGTAMVDRDIRNGRPYIRIMPNTRIQTSGPKTGQSYIFNQAFADRDNDSRYDNTFQTVFIANKSVTGTRGTLVPNVDTAIWLPDFEVPGAPQMDGTRPFKGIIIPPSLYSNNWYPVVKKFDDPSRVGVNDPSTRPVVIMRFSDVYLVAAEAAFKGGGTMQQAADMLNAIRQRAAYRSTNTPVQNANAVIAMTITDPNTITIDLILDERTREFYAEWQRWWDLARTQQLINRVTAWNHEAAPNIKPHHVLRPIPQDQIDRVTEGPAFPQNNGY